MPRNPPVSLPTTYIDGFESCAYHAPGTYQTELFELPIKMRCISPYHVLYLPQQSPAVDVEHLRRLGPDDDAIAVAQVPPYQWHEMIWGWEEEGMATSLASQVLNWLKNGRELHDTRVGSFSYMNEVGQLPSWVLQLTNSAPPILECTYFAFSAGE